MHLIVSYYPEQEISETNIHLYGFNILEQMATNTD
jgi:hypothetical protein